MIYLYDYAGQLWKTQFWTLRSDGQALQRDTGRLLRRCRQRTDIGVVCVLRPRILSSVSPGSDEYAIGSPLSPEAEIRLENGKAVTIKACGNSPGNRYIKEMKLGERPYGLNYLKYGDLTGGADIVFTMSDRPDTCRCTGDSSRPYSFSRK